jgi:GNAT superfamily N-acetyltransferase
MAAGARSRSEAAGARAPAATGRFERSAAATAALERAPATEGTPERVLLLDGTTARLSAIDLDLGPGTAFDDHVALIADDACGRMIGRATFQRVYGPRAVLDLEVEPALWHFGLPALLLEHLCARAARAGIVVFIARVPAAQVELLALLRAEFAARGTCEGAYVDVEFSTSVTGPRRRG